MLQIEKTLKHGAKDTLRYACDVKDVLPVEENTMETIEVKPISQLNKGEKRWMCKQVWGMNGGSLGSEKPGNMLTDEDLQAIFEYLQWQYQICEVTMVDPAIAKVIAMEGLSTAGSAECVQKCRDLMEAFQFVVVPVHSHVGPHWTAIVLQTEEESAKVKNCWYFDWLPTMQSNRSYARKILRLITMQPDNTFLELPPVQNHYVQRPGSNDCGLVVWYGLEVFMKQCRLEGPWKLYPNPADWRKKLQVLKDRLYAEQQNWNLEVAMNKKPKFQICLPGMKILDKAELLQDITKEWKAGTLKHKPKEIFGCSQCRWSPNTGAGCFSCNPQKKQEVKENREKQVKQLEIQLKKALKHCRDAGLITGDPDPEDEPAQTTDLAGGGDHARK